MEVTRAQLPSGNESKNSEFRICPEVKVGCLKVNGIDGY